MKKTISIWLLFCFLTTIFHFHPHNHDYEITSKQIINKQNDANHYFSNGCEKCLTKNNKSALQFPAEEIFNNFLTISKYKTRNFTNYFTHFNIYSRPPPAIIS